MVRITEIIPSHDGQIRAVKILRPDGTTTKAAVCNLFPLELEVTSAPSQPSSADEPNDEPEQRTDEDNEERTEEIENAGPFLNDDIDVEEY